AGALPDVGAGGAGHDGCPGARARVERAVAAAGPGAGVPVAGEDGPRPGEPHRLGRPGQQRAPADVGVTGPQPPAGGVTAGLTGEPQVPSGITEGLAGPDAGDHTGPP